MVFPGPGQTFSERVAATARPTLFRRHTTATAILAGERFRTVFRCPQQTSCARRANRRNWEQCAAETQQQHYRYRFLRHEDKPSLSQKTEQACNAPGPPGIPSMTTFEPALHDFKGSEASSKSNSSGSRSIKKQDLSTAALSPVFAFDFRLAIRLCHSPCCPRKGK